MASSNKKVTLEVAVNTEQQNIDALDKKLEDTKRKAAELKQQKIQMKFDADTQALDAATQKLKEAENKLAGLKAIPAHLNIDVGDEEIKAAEREVEQLKQEQINLQLQVESYKLDELQSKKDAIEADEINVQLNNQSAMQGLEQISDGFSRIKNSAMEVGQQFGELLSAAGKQETNFAFLQNAVGNAELARQKMSEINDIVAQLPGDDTALQGLLSSAAAKDSSLTAENLRSIANSATDYFSAMSYYGKSATEAQQDMTNYILAGNTAELERSPILQGHIDKLKQGTTVQERARLLAEALNEEHWGGIGAMDTYNNKLETFNGMIDRGKYTLGGMFQEAAKGAMDFLLKLDESTNGLVGMAIAAGSFLSPVTDAVMGIGQMATGLKALKDLEIFGSLSGIVSKVGGAFSSLFSILMANPIILVVVAVVALVAALIYLYYTNEDVRNAIDGFLSWLGGAWDAAVSAVTGAISWLTGAWQNTVNFLTNSPQLISDAIIGTFTWIYESIVGIFTGIYDWLVSIWQGIIDFFSGGGQTLWDTITGVFTGIYDTIVGILGGAFEWLQGVWDMVVNAFMTYAPLIAQVLFIMATGGIGAIVLLIAHMNGMPNQVGAILQNVIGRISSFVGGMVSNFVSGASNAVSGFMGYISSLPSRVAAELNAILQHAIAWGQNLISTLVNAARDAVAGVLGAFHIASPGIIQRKLVTEFTDTNERVDSITSSMATMMGENSRAMVRSWGTPSFDYSVTGLTDNKPSIQASSEARGNGQQAVNNITFNLYGDMDTEERMQKFLDYVIESLNWDNNTAGRNMEVL